MQLVEYDDIAGQPIWGFALAGLAFVTAVAGSAVYFGRKWSLIRYRPSNTSQQKILAYLISLNSVLPPPLIGIVDEYYSLSGQEVTQSIIAILRDAYKHQGVLTDARYLKIQAEYAPLVKEIDFSTIKIDILAFGQLFRFDLLSRYFCEGIKKYFPNCKRLIVPSVVGCSFQSRRNAFMTQEIRFGPNHFEKYMSSTVQIEMCKQKKNVKMDVCCFDLSSFFSTVNG